MYNFIKFVKSLGRGGARWQLTLCIVLFLTSLLYLGIRFNCSKDGQEHVSLSKDQLGTIKIYLDMYPDSNEGDSMAKVKSMAVRKDRDELILSFLRINYDNKIDIKQLEQISLILAKTSSNNAFQYLGQLRLLVKSPFYLTGNGVYFEAFFWSLFGVLVSLIYYVSLANSKQGQSEEMGDIGSFDPSEVPGQIAKMFYAPVCTIVLILGYHFISGFNDHMVDISTNKGLIVFAFISGFYSGRVMKFLDRLKDLLLPIGSGDPNPQIEVSKKANISVSLKLASNITDQLIAADIIEKGFKSAEVKLIPIGGGDAILLNNPLDDQDDHFTASDIPAGKYNLLAALAYKMENDSIINLQAHKEITLVSGDLKEELELQLVEPVG
ncbi:MAG: hypothetical protein IPO62_17175 [Saprospiraceae bacterium]|nr:hypothetical protein [Saprospiraceae bacterium]MBK9632758.1 hypothetical protein [Saprospiraceae bacterium]